MADRASGPVKPPVIDLTARQARPDSEPRPAPGPAPERGLLRLDDANWPLLGGAVAGGAVLGTILTYLLALLLPLPSHTGPLPPDLSGDVAAQAARLDTVEAGMGGLKTAIADAGTTAGATASRLDAALAATNKSIADVKAAIPAAQPPVDLAPLEAELKTLKAEIDAIGAGASGTDASAMAQNLATLETGLSSLTTRLNGADSTLAALRTDLDATRKSLADHISSALPNEVGPALKLPLILSGLESAFATGKPFQPELQSLTAVLPDVAVPAELSTAAATGLSRPDALEQSFEAALPSILAARDSSGQDWVTNATDWVKALLALRPAEEEAGDSPEAIVSRMEGAMGRRDYAAATALIGQLPAPMQQAAAGVAADIKAHAAADAFIASIRARALSAADATP